MSEELFNQRNEMIEIEQELVTLRSRVSHRKHELENRMKVVESDGLRMEVLDRLEKLDKVHKGIQIAINSIHNYFEE